jgi:hypothetical protein
MCAAAQGLISSNQLFRFVVGTSKSWGFSLHGLRWFDEAKRSSVIELGACSAVGKSASQYLSRCCTCLHGCGLIMNLHGCLGTWRITFFENCFMRPRCSSVGLEPEYDTLVSENACVLDNQQVSKSLLEFQKLF